MKDIPIPETLEIFAENLIALRKQQRLTQAELAEAVGLSRCSIIYYESKQKSPSLKNLQRFAQVFEVPMSALLEPHSKAEVKKPGKLITCLQLELEKLELLPPKQQNKIYEFIKRSLALA